MSKVSRFSEVVKSILRENIECGSSEESKGVGD